MGYLALERNGLRAKAAAEAAGMLRVDRLTTPGARQAHRAGRR